MMEIFQVSSIVNRILFLLGFFMLFGTWGCRTSLHVQPPIQYELSSEVNDMLNRFISKDENHLKSWAILFQVGNPNKINLLEIARSSDEANDLETIATISNRYINLGGGQVPIIFSTDLEFSTDWNHEDKNGGITSTFLFGGGFFIESTGGFKNAKIVAQGIDLWSFKTYWLIQPA